MPSQQPTRASIKALFIVLLVCSALIALIATFLPSIIGSDDEMTTLMRIVFYAAAALSVGQAFWLKAKLTKQLPPEEKAEERKTGGTVQRQ